MEISEVLKGLAFVVAPAVVRSVAGWAENALKDSKVTSFEWKKLVETVIRVGLICGCEYLVAAGLLKIDMGIIESVGIGAIAILTDKIFRMFKKK